LVGLQPLFGINQSGQYLKQSVFENDAKLLQVGQQVAYHTTAEPDHIMRARVSLINRNLNDDRTVEVRCTPEVSSTGLMPGTFVNAEIGMNNRVATVIPDEGIVSWQGRRYVFVQQAANTYRMQVVEKGKQLNGFTVLKTAISSACVTSNAYALLVMLKNKSEN
jgi:cobalt-zinc-cadmium efflux system membrane fusion protein